MCDEKECFCQKLMYKRTKHRLATTNLSQKDRLYCGNTESLEKKNIFGPADSQVGDLT